MKNSKPRQNISEEKLPPAMTSKEELLERINTTAGNAVKYLKSKYDDSPALESTIGIIDDLAANFDAREIGEMYGKGGNTYEDVFEIFSRRLTQRLKNFYETAGQPNPDVKNVETVRKAVGKAIKKVA